MPVFAQFVLVALVLFLWESTLWLPLRGIALRRRWSGGRWKCLHPGALIATRELGLVPMRPLPPDTGLAPCQAPPLIVGHQGDFLIETTGGELRALGRITWDDLKPGEHHLAVGGVKTRISSGRCIELLRRQRRRGASPEEAVRRLWRLALSPVRAGREWRKWKLASAPMRLYGLLLTLGFFVGLPLVYMHLDPLRILMFAIWLWLLMVLTAGHLWWLGKRVYPEVRSQLRMDALLSLVVPFHAMRAMETASVHAMGTTHPAALVLSSGDLENPWLGRFVRRILHPMPGVPVETIFSSALKPLLADALAGRGGSLENYDVAPDVSQDEVAAGYCPRCHAVYLIDTRSCPDCRGLALRALGGSWNEKEAGDPVSSP